MRTSLKNKLWLSLSLILVLVILIGLILWLKPQYAASNAQKNMQHSETKTLAPSFSTTHISTSQDPSFSSKSQQDTQINCQIRVDGANRLIVNEQTKDCFEYFITQYGEKNMQQIQIDFLAYLKNNYKDPALTQLSDLWSRYMQYREQLGHLATPTTPKEDLQYYREILANIQNLRKTLFSDYEIHGLFGTQNTYDQYTINRMEILEDKTHSPTEKATQLKDLFNQLPDDWKENLQQLNQLEDLRKLTAEIKARQGSAEEIHHMRNNLVGAEATQRLEALDTQRNDWKQRVNQYLSERDKLMKSTMSDSAKQNAIDQLRSQQFKQTQEQTRLHTFESIHDQGGKLPFAE